MAGIMEAIRLKLFGSTPSRKTEYEPGIVPARDEEEKPIVGNHMVYGNEDNISQIATQEAAQRALKENVLRHAYDPYKKAVRVTVIDEEF